MPIKEVILSFLYMLPVFILLDRNKYKFSLYIYFINDPYIFEDLY
jgi:hypothetical protein